MKLITFSLRKMESPLLNPRGRRIRILSCHLYVYSMQAYSHSFYPNNLSTLILKLYIVCCMRNIPEHYKQQGIIIRCTLYLIRRCIYYIYTSSIYLYLSAHYKLYDTHTHTFIHLVCIYICITLYYIITLYVII